MSYTMEDFKRDYTIEHFPMLTPEEQRMALQRLTPEGLRELLQALPPEQRLLGLSAEEVRQLLDQPAASRKAPARKTKRKR